MSDTTSYAILLNFAVFKIRVEFRSTESFTFAYTKPPQLLKKQTPQSTRHSE